MRCRANPAYARAVAEARAEGRRTRAAQLERVLYQSAQKAADDPRYTTALIFALKNLDPEHFRDVHEQRIGPTADGQPIRFTFKIGTANILDNAAGGAAALPPPPPKLGAEPTEGAGENQ